ncbi:MULTISPECIES: hypothetical protein [unclassified Archaeoglobus]|jgi:hypothetical protein|uniref:hypothetical protein n=1 Tax=unclassified Archaeoglobus TaxID=2643606 RepID=UPI0025C6BF1F|nr:MULTISPECIES: hypothetical protein [unclassified Archaeoglobus]
MQFRKLPRNVFSRGCNSSNQNGSRSEQGFVEVIGELLILAIVVFVASQIALALKPPEVEKYADVLIRDAKEPLATNQAFDIIMIAGSVRYSDLKVVLRDATDGNLLDIATYNGNQIAGNIIQATISDADSYFSTGDVLRFTHTGVLQPRRYEITIVDKKCTIADSLVEMK